MQRFHSPCGNAFLAATAPGLRPNVLSRQIHAGLLNRLGGVALATFAGLALGALPSIARAATPTVTTTDDTAPDGCQLAPPSGNGCTLREAVIAANLVFAGLDTVDATGISGTIELDPALGAINITELVEIKGAGARVLTVSGPSQSPGNQLFTADSGAATVTISGMTLEDGHRPGFLMSAGGAVYVVNDLTLDGVVVQGSSAYTGGGAYAGGNLTVQFSTFLDNSAHDGGGFFALGQVSLVNSTVSGNTASVTGGGFAANGNVSLNFSTVTGNTVSNNDPGDLGGGFYTDGNVYLRNSIVANNTANTSAEFHALGTLDAKYSLVEGASFPAVVDGVNYNLAGIDPELGALADNGGPTPTHVPLLGSPVIDRAASFFLTTDQRRALRAVDGGGSAAVEADMGAVEYGSQAGPSFVVNEDGDSGDGVCSEDDCTLREAVVAANTLDNGPGVIDEVTFASDLFGGIVLGGTEIGISDELSITGNDRTVSADYQSRIFNVASSATSFTASGLELIRGSTVNNGGAIQIEGDLILNDVTIRDNHADDAGGGFYLANGEVTIIDSSITDNESGFRGGGFATYGIYSHATVASSTISNNDAISEGGGFSSYGNATVVDSVIDGNFLTNGNGGGFITHFGDTSVSGSTISNNIANSGGGGGLFVTNGALSLENSTISGNNAGFSGGGLFLSVGYATISNSTISGNDGRDGGGMIVHDGALLRHVTVVGNSTFAGDGGGVHVGAGDPLTLENSIVAGNTVSGGAGADIFEGAVTSDHSLVGVSDVGPGSFSDLGGSLLGTSASPYDPVLGVLADNGGPGFSHAPLSASPVIDAASTALCAASDQRGATRPVDGNGSATAECDMGAVELGSQASPFLVTGNGDAGDGLCTIADCTLREAVVAANVNANAPFQDLVTFDSTVTGTITLGGTEIIVAETLAIHGPGADLLAVDGNYASRILNAGSAPFLVTTGGVYTYAPMALSGLTLTHGSSLGYGGAVLAVGDLDLDDVRIEDNVSVGSGGGITVIGDLSMTDSSISGNVSNDAAGGLYLYGDLQMTDSSIRDNSADAHGGGFLVLSGNAYLDGSSISGNRAGLDPTGTDREFGGGAAGGVIHATNSTVSGNSSPTNGGGLTAVEGIYLLHATVTDNSAASGGGGGLLVLDPAVPVTLVNSIVAGNSAGGAGPDIYNGQVSSGFSLIGVSDNGPGSFVDEGGSLVGTAASPLNPMLGALADNGGPTWTHELLADSPAIDSAWQDPCIGFTGAQGKDQRGESRPFDGDGDGDADCDMGALELQYAPVSDIIFADGFEP